VPPAEPEDVGTGALDIRPDPDPESRAVDAGTHSPNGAPDGSSPARSAETLTSEDVAELLIHGELDIVGRLTDASNLTVLARVTLDGVSFDCVYKPVRGERPLWDFPNGTLAAREVGSAMIARAAGWDCVPPTYFREGPLGAGMVQRWIEGTDSETVVDLFPVRRLPPGWLPVFRAVDNEGTPVVLAHADDERLKLLATFDLAVNNADRKGSHVLPVPDGPLYGVDHGLTLHEETKLRTVLWGWAGTPLPEAGIAGLRRLTAALDGELGAALDDMLTVAEVSALRTRVSRLVATPVFRRPPEHRTPIPWPPL
jgi:uncharacterized repeat protein (TIGR03843 family)